MFVVMVSPQGVVLQTGRGTVWPDVGDHVQIKRTVKRNGFRPRERSYDYTATKQAFDEATQTVYIVIEPSEQSVEEKAAEDRFADESIRG